MHLLWMKMARNGRAAALSDVQFHAIGRALADPRRFAIFAQVAGTDGMGCSLLRAHEEIGAATISHHLKELAEAGLIEMQREGRGANLFVRRPVWKAYLRRLSAL